MKSKLKGIIALIVSVLMISGLSACYFEPISDDDLIYYDFSHDSSDDGDVNIDISFDDNGFDDESEDSVSEDNTENKPEDEYGTDDDWMESTGDDINPEPSIEEDDGYRSDLYEESDYLLTFRNDKLLNDHFNKHGIDMGFDSAEEYQFAAAKVVTNPDALHKIEKEDGDDVYYVESTNEFVVVSKDGYIRTYFLPDSGKKYYDKQ